MTDARMPERWLTDRRLTRLDDEHFVSYVYALMWSVSNRTDGLIEPEDLPLIPRFAKGSPKVLVPAGLWTPLDHGWIIADFMVTQTSKSELEVLENMRGREKRKKARQRAAKAAENPTGDGDVPGDSPGGRSRGTTQARQGKARQGQENGGDQPSNGWPDWRGAGPNPFEEYA
jgi:hypothetical protein